MYAHSIFMVSKSKADQMSLLCFHCFLSPKRESLQKYVCYLNLQPKKIGNGKSKALADAAVEKVDCLCGLVGSNEKERTDINMLIFGLQHIAGSDDNIQFYTVFL